MAKRVFGRAVALGLFPLVAFAAIRPAFAVPPRFEALGPGTTVADISGDGQVVVGSSETLGGFRWQAGTMTALNQSDPLWWNGDPWGVSFDGSVIVGEVAETMALRWVSGVTDSLPAPNDRPDVAATAVSDDGGTIGGFARGTGARYFPQACKWEDGTPSLLEADSSPYIVTGISADGSNIVCLDGVLWEDGLPAELSTGDAHYERPAADLNLALRSGKVLVCGPRAASDGTGPLVYWGGHERHRPDPEIRKDPLMRRETHSYFAAVVGIVCAGLIAIPGCQSRSTEREEMTVNGTALEIDEATGKVSMKYFSKKKQLEITVSGYVTPETEIIINGRLAKLNEVKIGEQVQVTGYIEKIGDTKRMVATRIEIERPEWTRGPSSTTKATSKPVAKK